MRNKFDEQLELLNRELIAMGALCERSLSILADVLQTGDLSHTEEVILAEEEIDQKERDIERLCLRLLLQQQPVARDLRQISAALKMITDMERIGDHAQDICEIILESPEDGLALDYGHISQMASAVLSMVRDSIHAFVSGDIALCESIGRYDDVVDDLFEKAKIDVIQLIRHDVNYSEKALDLFTIAKYFERIGDHATNTAEWVMFSITGEHPSLQ